MDNTQILLGLMIVLLVVVLILFAANLLQLRRAAKRYRSLTQGAAGKNLDEYLCKLAEEMAELKAKQAEHAERVQELERISRKTMRRIELYKFNAFKEMGGELSFALALLDEEGDGLVLSNICGREDARLYARAVEKGSAAQVHSAEERRVIEQSMRKKI